MPSQQSWNWQQSDWPHFRYDSSQLDALEAEFLRNSGVFTGAVKHVADEDRQQLVIELIGDEALNSSEIENKYKKTGRISIKRQDSSWEMLAEMEKPGLRRLDLQNHACKGTFFS